MPTVPNQRVVKIHRDMPGEREGNFLLIKKSNLYDAYKNLNATALCLYLYLAGNMNGYNLEFSPKAIHEEMGMPESTCRDQFKVLVQKGYALFSVAKVLCLGTNHMTLCDLADTELIPPKVFAIICNSMAIYRLGLDAIQEVPERKVKSGRKE